MSGGIDIYNEGYCYYTGSDNYPLNYQKALSCFQKAAELGVSQAMNYLGVIYEDGEIVQKNIPLAVRWYFKAIETNPNDMAATYNIGRLYYNGIGVEKNISKAHQLCKRVVDAGPKDNPTFPNASYLLGCILMDDYNAPKEAYPHFIAAAYHGDLAYAWYYLGLLTEKGITELKNNGGDPKTARDVFARDCYKNAANDGCVPAMDALGRLYMAHNDIAKAKPWIEKAAAKGYAPAVKRLKLLRVAEGGSLWSLFK